MHKPEVISIQIRSFNLGQAQRLVYRCLNVLYVLVIAAKKYQADKSGQEAEKVRPNIHCLIMALEERPKDGFP